MSVDVPSAVAEPPSKPDVLGNRVGGGAVDVSAQAARGGAVVFGSMMVTRVMGLLITAILARLLDPKDFGLIGMAFTLTGLLSVFGDMGLATAIIQRGQVTHAQVSSGFWLNVVFGCVLAGIAAVAAPLLANFYREPVIRGLTVLCGLGFPLAALGAQHSALLIRRLEFGKIAVSELLGVAVSGIVAAVMAYRGFGVYALVGQQLAWLAVIGAMAWVYSGWLPSFTLRRADLVGTLRFGGYLTAFNFVNYFSRNLDNVLVGRFAGAIPLGLYTRAYALMTYPISLVSSPISRVATPTLSKFQDDHQRMRDAFVRVLKLIGFISFPMMTLLFVVADDVIRLMYGADWAQAVPIFRVLCIAGMYQGIYSATGQIFVSTGRTDRMFYSGTVTAICLALAFGVGIMWGALGVAWAYAIVLTVILLPYLAYAYSTIQLSVVDVSRALFPSLAGSAALAIVACMIAPLVPRQAGPALRIAIVASVAAITYVALFMVVWRNHLTQLSGGVMDRAFPRAGHFLRRVLPSGRGGRYASQSCIRKCNASPDLPHVVHLVYREGLSAVIESTVVGRVRRLHDRGIRTHLVFFASMHEFTSRDARLRWRERLAVIRAHFGGPVHRLTSPPVRAASVWSDSSVLRRWVKKHFRADEPIIFHCRGSTATQLGLDVRARRPNVSVIFDMRGLEADEYLYGLDVRDVADADAHVASIARRMSEVERTCAHQADAMLCVSRAMVDHCANRFGIDPSKARVIPCGVESIDADLERQRGEMRRRLQLEDKFVVAFCGSSHRWQMAEPSIELFAAIRSWCPAAHFLALTTAPDQIQRLVMKFGVKDATVTCVPHDEVWQYLAAADVGLLLRERSTVNAVASPVKFGEFMAAGVPVIMSKGIGDFSDLVRREGVGFVLQSHSHEAELTHLRAWIDQLNREVTGARCREVARRYLDQDVHIEAIVEMYQSLNRAQAERT